MVIIGVDPHKRLHVASVVEPATNGQVAVLQVEASLAGYRRLLKWGGGFGERRWAVENARGLGRHLAQWLLARGEVVVDVPSTATARVRELSRGGRRKNDVIDAAAAASVAALQGEANPVLAEDLSTVLALLDERRNNLSTQRTRLVNQLHAMFRDLVPGGAPTDLTATIASGLLTRVRPAGPVEAARKQLARDLVAEIRDADQRLKALTVQIADTVAATGSWLTEVDGVGPVVAARLLARTRRASRFPTAAALPATPASPRWRFPAPNECVIACPAAVIDSSTSHCISSRSLRCGCVAVRGGPTTTPRSQPARLTTRRCAA